MTDTNTNPYYKALKTLQSQQLIFGYTPFDYHLNNFLRGEGFDNKAVFFNGDVSDYKKFFSWLFINLNAVGLLNYTTYLPNDTTFFPSSPTDCPISRYVKDLIVYPHILIGVREASILTHNEDTSEKEIYDFYLGEFTIKFSTMFDNYFPRRIPVYVDRLQQFILSKFESLYPGNNNLRDMSMV
jgi:hypothetical protein